MRKMFFLALISAILICGACKDKIKPGSVEPRRKEVSGVATVIVAPTVVDSFAETSGTVKANNVSVISSRLMGTVIKVTAREGDKVNAGDTLIIIDDSDMTQKVAAAAAGFKEAQKALEAAQKNSELAEITRRRYAGLLEEKVISQQEFDEIETNRKVALIEYERAQQAVERARAMEEEARVYHGFTRIKAPYRGCVTAKKIDEGTMAVPGVPLMVVEDTSRFKIDVPVDERFHKNLSVGMAVSVIVVSTNDERQGTVARIAPAVDPSTHSFNTEIALKGACLKTGLFAKVLIPVGKKEAILVPKKSVIEKGQLTGVYTVDKKRVISYTLVKTGKLYGDQAEVLSGLGKGDRIIVDGVERAVDGGKIKE